MKKIILTILTGVICSITSFAQSNWAGVGSSFSSSNASLAISNADTAYTAFREYDGSNWKISVKKFDGTSWIYVGAQYFSAGEAQKISLAINASGTPYVAYIDPSLTKKLVVQKFDGTSWVNVGTHSVLGTPTYPFLTFDNNDVLNLGYNNVNAQVTLMKFDGSSWSNVGASPFVSYSSNHFRVAFNNSNTPFIGFSNGGTSRLWEYNSTNTSWIEHTTDHITTSGGQKTDMTFYNNELYTFFPDGLNGSKGSVKKYTDTTWEYVGQPAFTDSIVTNTNMKIDENGIIYVSFADKSVGDRMTVMKYDGTSWSLLGTKGQNYFYTSYAAMGCIALNSNNELYRVDASSNGSRGIEKFNCIIDIPDANFKSYLVGNSTINTNGDSEIQCYEANSFTGAINCNNLNIADLTGIEHFTKVTELNCSKNQITSLNIVKNTTITKLNADENDLSTLNVQNGNNSNFTLFTALSNTNLTCIQVDDYTYSNTNWTTFVDNTASFSSILDLTITKVDETLTVSQTSATYQWIYCDSAIVDGETSATFTATKTGDYSCEITQGCSKDTSVCFSVTAVNGINKINSIDLKIYPNPTTSILTIDYSKIINTIIISDLIGKTVKTISSNSRSIDVSDLNQGIYILKVTTKNGVSINQFVKK